jgi:serine phosphatase RsbU (regulator of sigma subunit)
VIIADGRGREYYLLHERASWRHRETRRDEWGQRTRWREWSDAAPEPVELWKDLDYDPRRRPWYLNAIAARVKGGSAGRITWTEPYTFYTTKEPGITASVTFEPDDGIDHVVGFDVQLSEISEFTRQLRVGTRGLVFVLTDGGEVIGLPFDPRYDDPAIKRLALLKRPEELELAIASDAADSLAAEAAVGGDPIRFASGETAWWGQMRPFALAADRRLWIAGVVPESDLLGNVQTMRRWIILMTAAVLVVAMLWAVFLARRYSRPIEALVRQSDRMSRGDLERAEPIDSIVREVRRLADAQERMRVALQSLLKMERDLQLARQIQLGTFPERIPKLGGFEIEAWSEPAEQTGGDTYDVIGLRNAVEGAPRKVTSGRADRAIFLLADATGHGIGPAISVTQVRAMLRMGMRSRQNLAAVARHLNEQLCADLHGGRFVTVWLAELDASNATLTSFSGGQAPLFHYDAAGGRVHVLKADAPPLGILDEIDVAIGDPIHLGPGDIFAVLSDGIFEAEHPERGQFGTARVGEIIAGHCGRRAAEILQALRDALAAFTDGAPAADDRTAVIIKRLR